MRILHVTPTFAPAIGGIETVVDCLSRETLKHGIVADVAHVARGLSFSCEEKDGRTIWRIPLHGHSLAGVAPLLRRVVVGYDLLHVHDPQLLSITANIRAFCRGVPAVLSTHGGFRHTQRFSRIKTLHECFLLKNALSSYRRILATSTNDRAYFATFSDRVVLAENGIDIGARTLFSSNSRSSLNWLYWGRIARHKRVDLVCDLALRARAMGFDIRLTICGPDFDGSLLALRDRLDSIDPEVVRYVEPPDEVTLSALIADAGVYVTASEYEGFGLTILEAMASGLTVIARAMPPIDNFVSPDTGLLLHFDGSKNDDSALQSFLTELPRRAVDLGTAARKMAGTYQWEVRIPAFLDTYRCVLDEASVR